MCCSLYSEESANVDIAYAKTRGIVVKGIRDYGDRGVVEFVLCELVRFLHGYDRPMWSDQPLEITGLKAGIIGLGVSGGMIAEALQFMGAQVSYYSRTRKPEKEAMGLMYRPLEDLLAHCQVIFTCLNKNVILLGEKEFAAMGNGKLLFNTSIGPSHELPALRQWLGAGNNWLICDTAGAVGDEGLLSDPHVVCEQASAGCTAQAYELLTKKVLDNIREFLQG
jgi:phosphoglycerate dehydrogenase-like enzyme